MKNNRKRFELCIQCFEQAQARFGEDFQGNLWDVKIKIMKEHIEDRKHWTNVALYHPNVNRILCDDCKYVLEHTLLQGEK